MPNTPTHTPVRPTSLFGRPGHDRRLLSYVGRHGAVSIAHVMAALGLGQSAAYDRVAALIAAGLLERLDLLRGEPALLRATRGGLRYAGLGMAPAVVSPGSVDHWLRCASVALDLEGRYGPDRVLSERELAFAERHEGRPIASARLGELPNGAPRLHRPDLVVLPEGHPLVRLHQVGVGPYVPAPVGNPAQGRGEDDGVHEHGDPDRDSGFPGPSSPRTPHRGDRKDDGGGSVAADLRTRPRGGSDPSEISGHQQREGSEAEALMRGREISDNDERALAGAEDMGVVAIEVELTPKSPKRLREIIRGWRRARWVSQVEYLCEPGPTRRAVERAVEQLHASDRVRVEGLR